jgi:HEPN domain-containing protein
VDPVNKIREIQQQLKETYAAQGPGGTDLPLPIKSQLLRTFACSYSAAAKLVSESTPGLWLVSLQLAGQSVELALKACISVAGAQPPKHHQLVDLYCLAADHGFEISEREQALVVHLEHFYFRDLATETRFKARYPTDRDEALGGAVPDNSDLCRIVESLCKQAENRDAKEA